MYDAWDKIRCISWSAVVGGRKGAVRQRSACQRNCSNSCWKRWLWIEIFWNLFRNAVCYGRALTRLARWLVLQLVFHISVILQRFNRIFYSYETILIEIWYSAPYSFDSIVHHDFPLHPVYVATLPENTLAVYDELCCVASVGLLLMPKRQYHYNFPPHPLCVATLPENTFNLFSSMRSHCLCVIDCALLLGV